MPDVLVTAEELANTYAPSGYASGWASVEAYRRWNAWQGEHPDAGRVKAGNALEMPPERVRVWQDGGRPDAVRGLDRARERGWLAVSPDTDMAEALIRLLAWVYSSGSLVGAETSQLTPRFSVRTADERQRLERWAGQAGVELRYDHDDNSSSGAEAIPATDGNLLGRVLVTLGATPGPAREYVTVPRIVNRHKDGPIGRWFVATYLRNRGTRATDRPRWVQFREVRDERYHAALADLFRAVVDADVYAAAKTIRLEAAAAQAFLDGVDDVVGPEREWGDAVG